MMDFAHDSPVSDDHEHDSSSSSSGDHSSPSDDLGFPSPPTQDGSSHAHGGAGWPYDMTGLAIPTLVGLPGHLHSHPHSEWGEHDPAGKRALGLGGLGGGHDDDPTGLALMGGDFWSTAPSTTVHSPAEQRPTLYDDLADVTPDLDLDGRMEVEFDDVVHNNVCGPSSLASPQPFSEAPSAYSALAPSSLALQSAPEHLFLSALSMSMPLDLHAVNAGIAPQLMGGERSPPLDGPHQARSPSSTSSERERDSSGSRARGSDSGASRDTSASRRTKDDYFAVPPAHQPTPPPVLPPVSTNLVAKDAVVAATVIPSLAAPPPGTIALDAGPFKLLVLGVPTVGAKSRVETQIKISLVLVAPKAGRVGKGADVDEQRLMTPDGGLVDNAGDDLERIGSWSHVRLPKYLALKKKNKKQAKADPTPEDTLFLDVAVIRGSEPFEEIFICTGCQQRELKRAQRKKDARVRPASEGVSDAAATYGVEEDEERRKVVVFNCAEFVEFGQGETVLPTRITCYCRHHKERKGFSVGFTLRTAAGVIVASGATPPIMITDDHKTSIRPPAGATVADVSVESIEPPAPKPTKRAKTSKPDKPAPEPSQSTRPKRSAGRQKAARGSTESDDDGGAAGPSTAPPPRAAAGNKKAAKPYDSDGRPRKRQSGVHRSPSFAMTPLVMSKPGSPVLRAVPLLDTSPAPTAAVSPIPATIFESPVAVSQSESWESALGLGGMDAVMQDAPGPGRVDASVASSSVAYSNEGYSTAPSPAQSNGWRSDASSPRSVDPFANMFNGLNSPLDMLSPRRSSLGSPLPLHNSVQHQQHAPLANNDSFASLYDPSANPVFANWPFPQVQPAPPPPRISRLIPGEGPVHGGIEVTVLGENFVPDLVCVFGDSAAVPTHFWSSNTLVCILPPSANPGPVVVGIKGVPLTVEQGTGLQLFTYKDDSDRNLLELALQVVGLKMTGRLEDASAVAMRIVGNSANPSVNNSPAGTRHASPTDGSVLAGMAAFSSSRPSSRAPSRQASQVNLTHLGGNSPPSASIALPQLHGAGQGETRNFEGIVIKFLSLLDLDPSQIPGAAPSLPRTRPPISHLNAQRHTLLHLATVLGFHRLVQFLLARGIQVDSPDRNGYSPLHFAALYGRVAITRMLLEAGAQPYPRNLAGKTPLDIARDRDDVDVEDVFLRSAPRQPARAVERRPQFLRQSSSHSRAPVRAPSPELRPTYSDSGDSVSSADESDDSFRSSDDDSDDDSSDVERRLSRNASMVSLHYLLEAEADVDAEYDTRSDSDARVDAHSDAEPTTPGAPPTAELAPTTTMDELANAAGTWLSRSLKSPALPFPHQLQNRLPQLQQPLVTAWEKMRPQMHAFQMPELAAFPTMPGFAPWRSGTKPGALDVDDANVKAAKEKVPWWPRQSPALTSPPPMYTPTDSYSPPPQTDSLQASASSSTSASTLEQLDGHAYAPRSNSPPTKAQIQAKLQRRVGYVPEEISDSLVQSFVSHEKKMHRLRDDRMLAFFWLPILVVVSICTLYSSFGSIQPFLLALGDAILPFARSVRS